MALLKTIELSNGVTVTYHRIVSVIKVTNNSNIIEVASYTSQEKRQEEIDYYNSEDPDKSMNVFIYSQHISKEYDEEETIVDAYEYLKSTDMFKDAEDVYEEGEEPKISETKQKAQAYDILIGGTYA